MSATNTLQIGRFSGEKLSPEELQRRMTEFERDVAIQLDNMNKAQDELEAKLIRKLGTIE